MAAGDLFRVVLNTSLQNSSVQNVLYYKVQTDDGSGDNQGQIANAFISQVVTSWQAAVGVDVGFECVSCQKVFPLPLEAIKDFDVGGTGSRAGESLPAMDAALIQKVDPSVGGQGKKGRVYVAGMLEADQEFGRLDNAANVLLTALANAIKTDLTGGAGGDYEPVWAVRSPTTPFAITGSVDVVEANVLPRIATQRRRRTPVRSFV